MVSRKRNAAVAESLSVCFIVFLSLSPGNFKSCIVAAGSRTVARACISELGNNPGNKLIGPPSNYHKLPQKLTRIVVKIRDRAFSRYIKSTCCRS